MFKGNNVNISKHAHVRGNFSLLPNSNTGK